MEGAETDYPKWTHLYPSDPHPQGLGPMAIIGDYGHPGTQDADPKWDGWLLPD